MIREKILRLHRHKSSSSYSSAATDASAQKFDFIFSNIQATQVPKGWEKIYVSLISLESGKTVRKSVKVNVKNGSCKWTETFAESIWISDIDMDECLFKILVATGSSKSSILGEAKLNLAAFLSSESSVLLSLPLKKCNYGTVLQVEVKCLTPKTNPRDEKLKGMNAAKDENADHDTIEIQSEASESLSRNNIGRETSYSFDSMDDSVGRQSYSSQSERFGRQDSIESSESSSYGSYSAHGSVKSVRSLQSHGRNQREEFRKSCHAAATLLQPNLSLKEGGGDDDHELEAEARMWEQNARKLGVEMERLRDELSDQHLSVTKLNMELAASRLECRELTQEIEHVRSLLEAAQSMEFQELGHGSVQRELEEEIRFQKEENENLAMQLSKTQESNIELISILQEMEETIEKQKIEMQKMNQVSLNESKSDSEMCEMEGALQCEVLILENALQERNIEMEIEEDLKRRVVREFVADCNRVLAEKEQQIMDLGAVDGRKDIKQLKEKVRGLEADCDELREENLELLYELKYRINVCKSGNEEKTEILQEEIADLEDLESIGKEGVFVSECSSKSASADEKMDEMDQTELMKLLSDLQGENVYLLERVAGLEAQLRYLTDTRETSRLELQQREARGVILEERIKRLEEENEAQAVVVKEKMCEMEKKWLEAEEARVALGEVNITLQATTESLMEEYSSLQRFNGELREQKRQLQSRCMDLETKARMLCAEEMRASLLKEESNAEEKMIMFKSVMECEAKLKSIINELDSKLELSEGERLRLAEENSLLHMQLEKVSQLQRDVLALRVSAQQTRSQNQQLEASLKRVSRDYEELERVKLSMGEEICSLQRAVAKEEGCRLKRNALEEKILRLEGDLIARDALCVQEAEMKNELNQIKMVNSQLLMKVKHLESVRGDELKETRRDGTRDESQLERAKSSRESEMKMARLEAELQEIRGRYFEMSINYAEVEEQREQLVMKLKALNV
ncbi:uncharacterized protein LOC131006250 [Salvia miltiorrhiza]|uniref:uncharacterized protein LOC131006250 n=1 Tax=Salvia miltiorrhiza TaxID=226208 RepID=UPI0025AC3669|nr:uncharacterized protein LOC131006250 [Salvia miltiorrhiza]